jgi:hypothetical protein
MPAGCLRVLIFLICFEKCSINSSAAATGGGGSDIPLMRNLLTKNHCMGCFNSLFRNTGFCRRFICDELAAYHAAETDSHQILHVRLVAEIVANNEELYVFGVRFRYWLPVNSSTIYRCRRSLIFGIVDVHISLPVPVVVFQ